MADSDDDKLVSLSGAPILRYGEREKPFEPAIGSEDDERLEAHISEHFGNVDVVYHELLSDLVHVDVHRIPPAPGRDWQTLVTTGMSDRPMAAPDEYPQFRHAELLISLPASWPISDEAFKDEKNYWPVRLLKTLARFPHEHDTWLCWGHSIANAEPPEPYDASVEFTAALLAPPAHYPEEALTARLSAEKAVMFYAVYPLYQEELELKMRDGSGELLMRFEKYGVTELLDPGRRNVARKKWLFF